MSNDYNSIYFKIFEINTNEPDGYIYTSPLRNNITSTSVSSGNEYWNLSLFQTLPISENPTPLHRFEFYDENDNLISKTDGIWGYRNEFSIYNNEDRILITQSIGCDACDYIEITVNQIYTDY